MNNEFRGRTIEEVVGKAIARRGRIDRKMARNTCTDLARAMLETRDEIADNARQAEELMKDAKRRIESLDQSPAEAAIGVFFDIGIIASSAIPAIAAWNAVRASVKVVAVYILVSQLEGARRNTSEFLSNVSTLKEYFDAQSIYRQANRHIYRMENLLRRLENLERLAESRGCNLGP